MATGMEFVTYKEFVEGLSEASEFASSDKSVVSNSTDGPRKMPKTTAEKLIAQSTLAGNIAKAFLSGDYVVGNTVVKDGALYRCIYPHSGAWDASHFVAIDSSDYEEMEIARRFIFTGNNLASQIKYVFLSRPVSKIKVYASPNPWDTSSVGGSNPTIFQMEALKEDGSLANLFAYYINQSVPETIEKDVPDGTVAIRCFFRASVGVNVSVSIESLDFTALPAEVELLNSNVEIINTDVALRGSVDALIEGKGMTVVEKFLYVKGLQYVEVSPNPNSWSVDSISSGTTNVLILYAVDSSGTSTTLFQYAKTQISSIPSRIFCVLPSGTERLRIFFRADSGTSVNFNVAAVASKPLGEVESVGFDLVGANATSVTRYIPLSRFLDKISIDVIPANWGTYSAGTNPTMFQLDVEDASGSRLVNIYTWTRDSSVVKGPYYHNQVILPSGAARIKVFFRGGAGQVVSCVVHASSGYIPFSQEDKVRVMSNAYRRNTRIAQCVVVGDPHDQKDGLHSAFLASKLDIAIDFVLCVGDICNDHPTETGAYSNYGELMRSVIPVLPVIGNHDTGSSYYVGNFLPVEKVVENVMGPAIGKGFIPSNTRGYYHKDFDSRKLRVIVVNQYEVGGDYGTGSKWEQVTYDSSKPDIAFSTAYSQDDIVNIPGWTDYSYKATENVTTPASAPSSWSADIPCWHNRRPDAALFGQTQAQWIADTLLSTPANYGVVIATHTWFSRNAVADETKKFTTRGASTSGAALYGESDFLSDIVDAFKNGSNYSETVNYNTIDPYTVTCNFTNKNTGVKFLGFVGGHFHSDIVFKHSTKEWIKAIHVCAAGSNSNCDIRLLDTGSGFWYYNFTMIGFDVGNNAMNLIKIGNKLTDDGYIRDCERIENV